MIENDNALKTRLLRIPDVAQACGVSVKTVYNWIASDSLPVHRMPGRGMRPILRIDKTDLDQWLAARRRDPAMLQKRDQSIILNGRKFIRPDRNSNPAGNRLDFHSNPASRLRADAERQKCL